MGKVNAIYWPTITVLVLAFVVLVARYSYAFDFDALLPYLCQKERCTGQDWLSATSGLLGGVAATIGAYLVFGQLREQRRQTAFALGDSPPEVELVVAAQLGRRAQFEVVNWNRSRITIENITVSHLGEDDLPLPKAIVFQHSEAEGQTYVGLTTAYSMSQYVTVGGWRDRQKAPHFARFAIIFDVTQEDYSQLIYSLRGELPRPIVTVSYGLANKRFSQSVELSILNLLPHRRLEFVLV